MVNMTPAVPSLSAEPPINGNGTNGHSVSGNMGHHHHDSDQCHHHHHNLRHCGVERVKFGEKV